MFSRVTKISIAVITAVWTLGSGVGESSAQNDSPRMSAQYMIQKGTNHGKVILTVDIPDGSHIYALTQKGTPPPTQITVKKSKIFKLSGKFAPNKRPKVIENDPIFDNRIEKHTGLVKFSAPLTVTDVTNVEKLRIAMKFTGLMCDDIGSCLPLRGKTIPVKFAGYYQPPKRKKQAPQKSENTSEKTGSEGDAASENE